MTELINNKKQFQEFSFVNVKKAILKKRNLLDK